ncbi:hypothetical protein MIR68_003815 [Amoeboaphelidium protococcarum]|nr:hypothetical protein MIR68_003815 [Amoeboaphelidium protococcarum]
MKDVIFVGVPSKRPWSKTFHHLKEIQGNLFLPILHIRWNQIDAYQHLFDQFTAVVVDKCTDGAPLARQHLKFMMHALEDLIVKFRHQASVSAMCFVDDDVLGMEMHTNGTVESISLADGMNMLWEELRRNGQLNGVSPNPQHYLRWPLRMKQGGSLRLSGVMMFRVNDTFRHSSFVPSWLRFIPVFGFRITRLRQALIYQSEDYAMCEQLRDWQGRPTTSLYPTLVFLISGEPSVAGTQKFDKMNYTRSALAKNFRSLFKKTSWQVKGLSDLFKQYA